MLFTSMLMSLQLNCRSFVSCINFLHKTVTLPIHIVVSFFVTRQRLCQWGYCTLWFRRYLQLEVHVLLQLAVNPVVMVKMLGLSLRPASECIVLYCIVSSFMVVFGWWHLENGFRGSLDWHWALLSYILQDCKPFDTKFKGHLERRVTVSSFEGENIDQRCLSSKMQALLVCVLFWLYKGGSLDLYMWFLSLKVQMAV